MASNIRFVYAEKADLGSAAYTATTMKIGRRYLCLHNLHASQVIYAKFGATAESAKGHVIKAGEKLEFGVDKHGFCPIDYLSVYASGSSTGYSLVEGF